MLDALPYSLKVRLLKTPLGNRAWRTVARLRGMPVGNYANLPMIIRQHVRGRSFVDIGCMWGVNGEFSFIAEESGATDVVGVDVFGPTPEFEEARTRRGSGVRFVLGDAGDPAIIEEVGEKDVVFCAGVLYHHPAPFDLLVALRRMCRSLLILRTSTIPEMKGMPNAAIYWPMLRPHERKLWNLSPLGVRKQVGITDAFEPEEGYGNWFWGLTPSCLEALLATAGFRVEWRATEPFAQTLLCSPVEVPFQHRLPDAGEAREMARRISEARIAAPA